MKQSVIVDNIAVVPKSGETDGRKWGIRLEVYYDKGGRNMFSGEWTKRGYWASASPRYTETTVIDGTKYESCGFICGPGYYGKKVLVEESARFNQKRLDQLAGTSRAALLHPLESVLLSGHWEIVAEDKPKAESYLAAVG
jgi:hypothetical protein